MGLLDGKVALVTGAGGGLGRAHALLLASEGAAIIVNDLGGGLDGSGGGSAMADAVVAEIRERGGRAAASYGSVADAGAAQAMVDAALDAFGRIDIVVNNAGILRDKTLLKLDDANFDVVLAVHARGTFLVTRAAVKAMSDAGHGGTIINTTSIAGMKGNFGQTNYSAAKAGIAGMTFTWGQELQRYGIRVNAIAPIAKTRMTETISAVPDDITPEMISPMVLFLASDLSREVNGRVFGCHGKHLFEYHVEMSRGVELDRAWTVADIAARLPEISRLGPAPAPVAAAPVSTGGNAAVDAVFAAMPNLFLPEKAGSWSSIVHFEIKGAGSWGLIIDGGKCTSAKGKPEGAKCNIVYESADLFLGVLSGAVKADQAFMGGKIKTDNMGDLMRFAQCFDMLKGASMMKSSSAPAAPAKPEGLNRAAIGRRYRSGAEFVMPDAVAAYAEATNDPNSGYPEIAPPLLPVRLVWNVVKQVVSDPDVNVDLMRLVHGEQDMVFHDVLRPWDLVAARATIEAMEDKASGEVITVSQRLMRDGDRALDITSKYFIRKAQKGEKPAGGDKKPDVAVERTLAFTAVQTVDADQSYRYAAASLDDNPIHVDDTTARAAGFPSVILHGLCTMAFAGRAVIEHGAGGDVARLGRLAVRFARPVFPNDTLTTTAWETSEVEGKRTLGFEMRNQRGELVLTNGIAEIRTC